MTEIIEADGSHLGAVFERLSQDITAGEPPFEAIMFQAQRRRRNRRARQVSVLLVGAVVLTGGGWLAGHRTTGSVQAVSVPVPSSASATPVGTSRALPSYSMTQTFPQWSGTISGVHWTLGVVHPGGGTSCTSVAAGVGTTVRDTAIFACDQGELSGPGRLSTTGYTILPPTGHVPVGTVTVGQVNKAVKSVDCTWKGKHYTGSTFQPPGLRQTYFALGLADTSAGATLSECKLLDAHGADISAG